MANTSAIWQQAADTITTHQLSDLPTAQQEPYKKA